MLFFLTLSTGALCYWCRCPYHVCSMRRVTPTSPSRGAPMLTWRLRLTTWTWCSSLLPRGLGSTMIAALFEGWYKYFLAFSNPCFSLSQTKISWKTQVWKGGGGAVRSKRRQGDPSHRSVVLLMHVSLPCLLYASGDTHQPLARRFGVNYDCRIVRRLVSILAGLLHPIKKQIDIFLLLPLLLFFFFPSLYTPVCFNLNMFTRLGKTD